MLCQCDQRKPGCIRCEKSKTQCPGYRDLTQAMFRDDSDRTIRRVTRQTKLPGAAGPPETPVSSIDYQEPGLSFHESPSLASSLSPSPTPSLPPFEIPYPLTLPITDLAASFFFTKYTFSEPPFSSDYHDWLARSYFADGPNHVLRAAIEAVGMAGISNISYAPRVASKAKQKYCGALSIIKQALDDPVEAKEDTILMAVILLTLFEASTSRVSLVTFAMHFTHDEYRQSISRPGTATMIGWRMCKEPQPSLSSVVPSSSRVNVEPSSTCKFGRK